MSKADLLGTNDDLDIGIAFTGGVDSVALTYWLADFFGNQFNRHGLRFHLLLVDFGQTTAPMSRSLCKHHVERLIKEGWLQDCDYHCLSVFMPAWTNVKVLTEPRIPEKEVVEVIDYATAPAYRTDTCVDFLYATIFLNLMSYCSAKKIPVLYTGHQFERVEWDHINSLRHRSQDDSPSMQDRLNLLQELGTRNWVRVESPFATLRLNKAEICNLADRYNIDIATETYSCEWVPRCGKCDSCVTMRMVRPDLIQTDKM